MGGQKAVHPMIVTIEAKWKKYFNVSLLQKGVKIIKNSTSSCNNLLQLSCVKLSSKGPSALDSDLRVD